MQRRHWIEIHEQPWYPAALRNLTTNTLQFLWNILGAYKPIVPLLRRALEQADTHQVLDLCSGGGGPWPGLIREFEEKEHFPVELCLTDRFPNPDAVQHVKHPQEGSVVTHTLPVDAVSVPADLDGFRTIFTAFHHFRPAEARGILGDAVRNQRGVGVFEVPKRDWRTISLVLFVPIMAFLFAPFVRPFRWSRLLWTYLIPVIPFVLWFDGVVSCLRAYTPSELRELARGFSHDGYRWQVGETRSMWIPVTITYLIGYPLRGRGDSVSPRHSGQTVAASD